MLPLRITFAFKGEGVFYIILRAFDLLKSLKLFKLEFEADYTNLAEIIKHLNNQKISAHQKTIRIYDINSLSLIDKNTIFDEIEFELPNSFTIQNLKEIFDKIKGIEKISLSFFINKSNINLLDKVLENCIKTGIKKIVIPNPDLINNTEFVIKNYLEVQDLEKLDIMKKYIEKLDFQVHDYFMSKRLNLESYKLFRGCQAGKFLCYIYNGIVYPCKTVPIKCGSIMEENFESIWKRVDSVMKNISKGKYCIKCNNSKICYYGCPGTIHFINNGLNDPLCEDFDGNLS